MEENKTNRAGKRTQLKFISDCREPLWSQTLAWFGCAIVLVICGIMVVGMLKPF